uniref:Integrase catalytic domain-containing protein n=1 Tax=Acrobeloides nanus TaxID=290746 RepID=A0A914CJD7_9BILA
MVYQDHLTKYVLLRPIKSKTAEAVAEELMRIFADFGAPKILHTDNGREFANAAETKESVIASAMEVKAARIVIINNSRFVLCHCPFVIGYVV